MTVNKAIIICQSIVSPLSLAAKQLKRSRLDRAAQNSQPIKGFPFDQSEGAVYYFFGSLQLRTSVSFVVSLAILFIVNHRQCLPLIHNNCTSYYVLKSCV